MTIIRRVRGPRRWPGILACVLAVLMLVATALAIALSAQLQYAAATDLAYLAIALSAAAVVMGLIAIFGRWARGAGIVGALVAVLGNPLVLLYGLNYFGGN
jgi:drug/metabolite transporter (DMT)-like permease